MRKIKIVGWKKYAFEFFSIFIAVISAFALSHWNDNRRDRISESKILTEISNGLEKDLADVKMNKMGHQQGIASVKFFKNLLIQKNEVSKDSVLIHYFNLTRDFFSVQNTSGYETLKSKGLEMIENDSLRKNIISLYENDYAILRKFEEEYYETQFQENYYNQFNRMIAPNFEFNYSKDVIGFSVPLNLSETDEKIFVINLWKITVNRNMVLHYYNEIESKIIKLKNEIKEETER